MATAVLDTPDAISSAPPVQVQVISQWETALQSMVEEKVRSWYKLANQGIFTRRRTKGGKKHHHHDAPPLKQQQRAGHRDAGEHHSVKHGEHQHHSVKHHKKHHRGAENAAAPAHAVDVRVECEEGAAETTPLLAAGRTQQLEQKLLKGERVRAVWGIVTVGILVAPACACALFALLFPALLPSCLAIWAIVEVIFVAIRYRQLRHASDHRPELPLPSLGSVSDLLSRILKLKGIVDARYFFEGWFHNTPLERLTREHIKQFISFGFFYRSFEQLSPEYQEAVETHMHSIAQVWDLPVLRRPSASANQQQAEPSAEAAGAGAGAAAAEGSGVAETGGAESGGVETGGAEADPESGTVSWAAAAAAGAAVTAATTVAAAAAAGETAAVEVLGEMAEAVVGGEGKGGEGGEAESGGKWRNGEEGIGFMAHTQEPIRAVVHPLFVYAWGHMVAWLTWLCLALLGFRRHVSPSGLHYFHRPGWKEQKGSKAHKVEAEAESGAEGYDAVVFIHGLGIGLTPYLAFIHMLLAAFGSKPFIVVELPHLACQLTSASPTIEEVSAALVETLCKHGYKRVAYVGHSYSTFIAATLLRRHRSMIAAMSIIDPVCLLLCLPKVLHTFVYSLPGGDHLAAWIGEAVRWVLCSRELQVARSICRGFSWQEYLVWGDELPPASLVMLAGDDQLVPSAQVQSHLARHNVNVIYNEGFQHAEYLTRPDVQHKFIMAFAATCAKMQLKPLINSVLNPTFAFGIIASWLIVSTQAASRNPFVTLSAGSDAEFGNRWSVDAKPPAVHDQPLIGILSQPGDGDGGRAPRVNSKEDLNVSYIAASYVKWVESAGARPVPILYDDPDWLMEKKFRAINGLILPGGGTDLVPGPFFSAVEKLLKMALAANDAGDYFPVQGTCMGMETLTIFFSQDFDILETKAFNAEDSPESLRFTSEEAKKRAYFSWMTPELLDRIQTEKITMENHEDGTTVGRFLSSKRLREFFRILTTSVDRNGTEYVTTIEARNYPIYGTQWHPEKTAFEWGLPHIPHSAHAVAACQATANFFVNEARRSTHRPDSDEEMDEMLIYNYAPIFSGKNG
ncbi:unnamed protein product [Closterium sp. Naga37s-1]|nr:unnamed protein product [Closterium sp. Naga37s-1]